MKKRILSAFLIITIMVSVVFCFNSCSTIKEFPVTIGEVVIEIEPEKIVVLDKNLTDIISCIGYDVKLVGRSEEVDQKGIEVVPTVGTKTEPDVDKIAKLGTDLVITDKSLDESKLKEFKKAEINVVQFDVAETKVQLKNLYENVGRALGGNITGVKKAAVEYEELTTTLNNIKTAAQAGKIVKTVCYLYISNGVLKTMNNRTWGGHLLEYTGGINVFKNSETDIVDTEQLLLSNPDFIFCSDDTVKEYLENSEVLSELDSLENNTNVIPLDEITMQGYTALDVMETMLRTMYPKQFAD